MKNKKWEYLQSKVFKLYFYSYVGIIFLIIALLICMFLFHTMNNVRGENLRIAESKMHTIAEDMENQLESMHKVALDIANNEVYCQDYLQKNKFNEISSVWAFREYYQMFSIYESYFLKYRNKDTVFVSTGKTRAFPVYYNKEIADGKLEETEELLEQLCDGTKDSPLIEKQRDVVLFLYPLKNYTVNKKRVDSVLGFKINHESLAKRMKQLVQNLDGEFVLYYKDVCISGDDVKIPENKEGFIEVISSNSNFRLLFHAEESFALWLENVFSKKEMAAFFAILLLALLLGWMISYWSFHPIKKITNKYNNELDIQLEADWNSIDTLITSLWEENKINNARIVKQWKVLKEQIVLFIVKGHYTERIQAYMDLLNICHREVVYGVITCKLDDDRKVKRDWNTICDDIDELSGDGIFLYSSLEKKGNLSVLAVLEEEYLIENASELLRALFESKNIASVFEIQGIFHDLKEIAFQAEQKSKSGMEKKDIPDSEVKTYIKQREYLEKQQLEEKKSTENLLLSRVLKYIEEHCREYDLSLELVASEFKVSSTYLSKLIKQENGKGYKEYLTELRMKEAMRLLQDHNIGIAEVCQQVGYTNVPHFIKIFQKYVGVTPAKYRDERTEVL